MRIAFVTDSTADVPDEFQRRYPIEVVPALINIDGQSYQDGIDISREEFYERLPKMATLPTTSSPSVGSFQNCYERLLKSGASHVLSLHPPDNLSGIYNAARLAAQEFGERVRVLDSGQVTLGLGFQIIAAAEAAQRGAALEEILSMVASLRLRVRVAALLESMEYIRRSGRVSWAKAVIGNLMHIQPLIELRQGVLYRLGQARSHAQGVLRLTEALNSWGPLERLAVLHTNAEHAARQLLEEVKSRVTLPPILVNVTTSIGTHTGPNGLGFAAVPSA